MILILQIIIYVQLYQSSTAVDGLKLFGKIVGSLGVCMFIIGNILIINNVEKNMKDAFAVFTTGSVGFVISGSMHILMEHKHPQVKTEITEMSMSTLK